MRVLNLVGILVWGCTAYALSMLFLTVWAALSVSAKAVFWIADWFEAAGKDAGRRFDMASDAYRSTRGPHV